MDMDFTDGLTVVYIKVAGAKIKLQDMVNIFGVINEHSKVIG